MAARFSCFSVVQGSWQPPAITRLCLNAFCASVNLSKPRSANFQMSVAAQARLKIGLGLTGSQRSHFCLNEKPDHLDTLPTDTPKGFSFCPVANVVLGFCFLTVLAVKVGTEYEKVF